MTLYAVGDVQGCARTFEALLEKIDFKQHSDHLWLVGDLVNRGPDSLGVLRRVRALWERGRARVVLGNHELALLRCAFGQRRPSPNDTLAPVLRSRERDDWVEWVRRLPLVESGEIAGRRFAMVHAALDPDWSLDAARAAVRGAEARLADPDPRVAAALLDADPARDADRAVLNRVTTCRSVLPSGAFSADEPRGEAVAWHAAWRARGHDYGVVYGHWSTAGLYVAPGLRGLDTGCVHHGRGRDGSLAAWLPDARPDPFGVPDERFWRVPAHRRYLTDEGSPVPA